MKTLQLAMLLLQTVICLVIAELCLASQESYKAAVVEYHPLGDPQNGSNAVLEINVASYEDFIKEAAMNGAEIVVFPEYGLTHTSPSENRREMAKYAQIVPQVNPHDNSVRNTPCDKEEVSWVIKRISCSARRNQIYVVINLPEKVPCGEQDDHCPQDGHFIYNSNIAFDRDGAVISKYWKYNLFRESAINKPQEASHSTFSTDFNVTFGMFTCFDILWKEPAFDLVNTGNITDFVFPTAWFSQLPFLSAVQIQASWSNGLGVNLLASDYNNPLMGGGGSGIYSAVKGALSTYVPVITGSKLLIATVPKILRENFHEVHQVEERADQLYEILARQSNDTELHVIYEDIEKYNRSLPLKNGESEATICSGEFCCQFYADVQSYNASSNSTYRFVIFNGIRYLSHIYRASFQICSIIHCLGDEFHTCGHVPKSNNFKSLIRSLRISGNFSSSQMVLPNSVDFELNPIRTESFEFLRNENDIQVTSKDTMQNVLSFSIYGRNFQDD